MRIKEIREKLNISQKQLAKDLNIPVMYLYKYEKGMIRPSYETLIKIAEKLNCSVDALLGVNSNLFDYSKLTDVEKKLIDTILDFDEKYQQIALGYLYRLREESDKNK